MLHTSVINIKARRPNFITVSPGYTFTIALDEFSYAWAWGENNYGQLGIGTTRNISYPISVIGNRQWRAIASGVAYVCAIDSNSYAWGWGYNGDGCLGDNTATTRSSPVSVVGDIQWKALFSGPSAYATYALDSNSYAWAWGNNQYGQLGINSNSNYRSSPVSVVNGYQWAKLSAGAFHTLGMTKSSSIFAWGRNFNGQLGDGTQNNRSTPGIAPSGMGTVTDIAAGNDHSAAIKNGYIYCWGINSTGQLGNNDTADYSLPSQIFSPSPIIKIAASRDSTLAVDSSSRVWGWGDNAALVENMAQSSPVLVFRGYTAETIICGGYHVVANRKYFWGYNQVGQLGDGTINTPTKNVVVKSTGPAIIYGAK